MLPFIFFPRKMITNRQQDISRCNIYIYEIYNIFLFD